MDPDRRPWLASYEEGVAHEIDPDGPGSVPGLFGEAWGRFRDRPAFHSMGTTLTHGEVDGLSRRFAALLQNDPALSPGDRVALMMPNVLQYPVALLGVLRAGMVAVNVNPLYTPRELAHQLSDSGAKAVVVFENACRTVQEAMGGTGVERVLVTGIGDLLRFPKSALVNFAVRRVRRMVPPWSIPGASSFARALRSSDPARFRKAALSPGDTALLQYTGGTTGGAKGAVLTHGNICANVAQAREWIGRRLEPGAEVVLTPLPLYHVFSLTVNLFTFGSLGALGVLVANPRDTGALVKEMGRRRLTAITGVNTLFNALLNHPGLAGLDLSGLKIVVAGGMAVQRDVARRWREATGSTLVEGYGLTETSPVACFNPMGLPEFNGKVGLPFPSTEVAVRDDGGNDVPPGEPGEICVRGPQVMRGYWNRPEETAAAFTGDGFLRTGDIGSMDERGFVEIIDRKKDMVLVGGLNVYPCEVEDVLAAHPGVVEAAVVGVPRRGGGEAVKAFVAPGSPPPTEADLDAHCRANLAPYKVPREYEFRDSLPKTPVGKILRRELRR